MIRGGARYCIACGAPIGWREGVCPKCGALNTRGLGDDAPDAAARRKRLKILWWTYTVRGTEYDYIQAESAFGVTTTVSWGRWVVSNAVVIGVFTALALVLIGFWATTGAVPALVGSLLFAAFDLLWIAFFAWSMTPARPATR